MDSRIDNMKKFFVGERKQYWNCFNGDKSNQVQMNKGNVGLTTNPVLKSNWFNDANQCHGFAEFFMSLLHGKSLNVWTGTAAPTIADQCWKVYPYLPSNTECKLQPGDLIRMNDDKSIKIGEGKKKDYNQHTAVVSSVKGTGANRRVYVIQSLGDNAEINEYLFNEKSDYTPMEQNDNWIAYESTLKECCDYVVRFVGKSVDPIAITLKDNNGKMVGTIEELPGTRFFSLPDPYNYVARKTGAEAKWCLDDGSRYENGYPIPNGTTELKIEYIPEAVTVNFNAANGLPSDVTVTNPESTRTVACGKTYGSVYDPKTVKFIECDLPQPTCDGYRFDGWYLNSNGTETVDKNTPVNAPGSITLYAKWTRTKIKVTYHYNHGKLNGREYDVKLQSFDNNIITVEQPGIPTRDGYTFKGWGWTNPDDNHVYDNGEKIHGITDNITLSAQWSRIQVEITFDANGGSCDVSKQNYNSGRTDLLNRKEKYNDNSSLPTAIREGYTFGGWWTKIVGGEQHTDGDDVPLEKCTLYARWNVTVTFIDTVYGNSSLDVNSDGFNLPTVERSEMCDFAGWRNITTKKKHNEEDPVTATPGTVFEAIWNCNVTYAPDGGTDAPNVSTVERGSSYTVCDAPKKQGYYFKGWKCSVGDKTYFPGEQVTILRHTVFTALWDEKRVYITYEGKGTEHMSPQRITYFDLELDENTATTDELKIPTRLLRNFESDRWELRGWKLKSDHSENPTLYTANDGRSLPFVNQTLVAVTSPRPRTSLVFDANGGYGAPKEQAIYYDGVNVIPKEVPTHPNGLQFLSWYDVSPNADYTLKPIYATGEVFNRKYKTTLQAQWSSYSVIRYDSGIPVDDPNPVYDLPMSQTFDFPINADGLPTNPQINAAYIMPTREGYTAIGWKYTDLGGEQRFAFPGEAIEVIGAREPEYIVDKYTIVLSAVWKKNTSEQFVTVNFHDQYNGSQMLDIRKVAVGGTYGVSYSTGKAVDVGLPTIGNRNGNVFIGWALDGALIDKDTVVTQTEEHTLTAVFWYQSYEDLNENYDWATSSIYLCGYYGYMNGKSETEFFPGESVERRQVAIALYRMAGQPMAGSNKYWDVPGVPAEEDGANDTYERVETHAISWADSCGIAKGMTEDRFEPLGNTTRLQMALFLSRYAKLYMPTLENGDAEIAEDAELKALKASNAEAYDAVTWAASHGILTASEDRSVDPPKTTYELGSKVTRAQLAVVLIRLRDVLERYKHEQVSGAQHPADDESERLDELIGDFASNSWESISKASAAGVASLCWHVGDEKDITLSNGEVVTVQIYGFDHDDLSNGGKAGITLGLKNVMRSARRMDINATNADSFVGTELYRWLNGTLFEMLPDDLRAVIRAVDKKTSCGGSSTEYRTDSMKLFLFSESECFGRTHYSHGEEGEQYPIFTNDASRIKVLKGPEIYEWWERSPMSAYNSSFCLVHATGHAGYTSATTGYIGVAFGFCI